MTKADYRSQVKPCGMALVQPVLRNGGASSSPCCVRQQRDTQEWRSWEYPVFLYLLEYSQELASVITESSQLGLHVEKQVKGPVTADSHCFQFIAILNIIKEQNRELRGTQRAITRDRAALEKQEKQLELEIKKMAKTGNKEACKVLAKQLVQLRKQKNRTYAVSSKVTSMSTQTKVMNSQMKMAGAMSTTAKTMQAVNKKMDPQKTLQTMQNFQKENMKMEMTEEMINDTLDDIFDASDEEEESQDIVNQVLDEIGIEISGKMAKAPSAARGLPSASTSKTSTISDEEIERQLKALGVD
ncbi:PREDICTED: charged multivesicular body protein 2b [Leptosomus discolor]|nr:PREDICTED: charged multivesicular body protein 2b [Leptosomus discolor]